MFNGFELGEGKQPVSRPQEPLFVPRRKTRLENRFYTNSHGEVLEVPDQEILNSLTTSNPRIRYHHIKQPLLLDNGPSIGSAQAKRPRAANLDTISTGLSTQIITDLPGQELVVRGTKTSINGSIPTTAGDTILDIADVVTQGEEFGRGWFRATKLSSSIGSRITIMSISCAVEIDNLRNTVVDDGTGLSNSIFPVMLVYDRNQVEKQGDYDDYLLIEGTDPLLAAYIIDYPVA